MEGSSHGSDYSIAGLLLTLGTPAAVFLAIVAGFCLAKFQPSSQKRHLSEPEQEPGSRMVRIRRSNSDNECPICYDPAKHAIETNCGHMFCTKCFILNWRTNFSMTPMSCPFCRQEVTLLMVCFSENEMNSTEPADVQEKEKQLADIGDYNRMYSTHPRSLYGQLQDLPVILRHIWAELFTWRGIEMISRFRVLICIATAIFYAVTPIDLIPEAFVGLIGLIDDVVVIAFLLMQVCVVYRTVVANRDW